MKKIIITLIYILCSCNTVYALEISAKAGCVISADTGEIIFSQNETEKLSMASTTKIMTGLLATESGRLDDIVTVSENAQNQEGSSIYLKKGNKISLRDLTYGLMLNSGNDAAVAIAEHLSGSVECFSRKMTERAKEIGAKNTKFKNPNGLEAEGHYTTAYDLALIGAEAIKNKEFKEIVSAKTHSTTLDNGEILYFYNHNKLLKMYEGTVGIKTGFTKNAGRCLVSAAERNGVMAVAVTLNDSQDWEDHKKMLDCAFELIKPKRIINKGDVLKKIKGKNKEYTFSAKDNVDVGTVYNSGFEVVVCMPEKLLAPIAKGEKAGCAKVIKDGKYIKSVDIISDSDIIEIKNKKSIKKTVIDVIKRMV